MAYYILFNSIGKVYRISDSEEEKNMLFKHLPLPKVDKVNIPKKNEIKK
jgi:hypothetical protein